MILLSMENLRMFLETEMKKRGWKQADLARASNLDSAVISNIINGRRRMGESTGKAIAQALQLPVEEVFRVAGLLPPVPDEQSKIDELTYIAQMLDETDLQDLIDYGRFRLKKRDSEGQNNEELTSRSKRPARNVLKESRK